MSGVIDAPDLAGFRELALKGNRVIPVIRRLFADAETPIGLYEKLAGDRTGTFLLESAEHGGVWSRWSFVGVRAPATLTEVDGRAVWTGTPPVGMPAGSDPLAALGETVRLLQTPAQDDDELPPLTGGLVGYLGYDAVRRLEKLPEATVDDLHLPELTFLLATDLAALDHRTGDVLLIANAVNWDDSDDRIDAAWSDAVARLDAMTADLARPAPSRVVAVDRGARATPERQRTREAHMAAVEAAKEEIRAGEAYQVVVAQRFTLPTSAKALDVYRVLRSSNPSPYMYLLRLDGFDIVGSSPEAHVKVSGDEVILHPIAGSRPRGETPEADAELERELRADAKERAEHLMLVDLGRNDVGRVSAPGTVEVVDFMDVRRYSHIMHLESTVVGRLAADRTAFDALCATFPAGTLSGAPKPRAMQIIEGLEQTRRGLYGGVVGYLDFSGDADTAIAIRTAVIKDGIAYVQAGGGIVADSDPATEDIETQNKAAAVLTAIAVAESFTDA